METILINFKLVFSFTTILVYLLGTITFSLTLIIDWLSPTRTLKTFKWYLQEFLYTTISIILGMFICFAFSTTQPVIYSIGILMGLTGSTIIRKIMTRKEEIADTVVDKVKKEIDEK